MENFVAKTIGQPARKMYIYRDPPPSDNSSIRGWNFIVEEIRGEGNAEPVFDTWEERFYEILRYPPIYSQEALSWSDADSGEVVVLEHLKDKLW